MKVPNYKYDLNEFFLSTPVFNQPIESYYQAATRPERDAHIKYLLAQTVLQPCSKQEKIV